MKTEDLWKLNEPESQSRQN